MGILPSNFKAGLEDAVTGTTDLCYIDGNEGRLVYCGYDIRDLAFKSSFEETAYLLWHLRLPSKEELVAFDREFRSFRVLPNGVVDMLRNLPRDTHPMATLRTGVSALGNFDAEADEPGREANLRKSMKVTAQIGTLVTAWQRLREGKEPIAPRSDLSYAANFLYMLFGQEADDYSVRVFDSSLIMHADHELNASTFSARVTIATLSDIYSAVTSAIGTLKGPLHGGANEQVMHTLLAIGEPDNVEPWLTEALAQKQKISGFGHRVYRTKDPRAYILGDYSAELGRRAGQPKWFEMTQRVENFITKTKGLYPNVDLYSASAYYAMGIPIDLFTPIFAASRVSGWTAHILEQLDNNRLIRPRAEYTGPDRLPYPAK